MGQNINNTEDPCGEFGPDQRWAVAWFVSVIIIGTAATYGLSRVDRFNYDTKGIFIDNEKYRQNRLATTSIGSETRDPRASSLLKDRLPK